MTQKGSEKKIQKIVILFSLSVAMVLGIFYSIDTLYLLSSSNQNQMYTMEYLESQKKMLVELEYELRNLEESIGQFDKVLLDPTLNQTSSTTISHYAKMQDKMDNLQNQIKSLEEKIDQLEPQIIINTVEKSTPSVFETISISILPAIITGIFALVGYKLLAKKS